jgi:hypothetical protein
MGSPVFTANAYTLPLELDMYATPPDTTAPFSSTEGALECHRSVKGSSRVSPCDAVFPALPRELGHSEAIADAAEVSSAAAAAAMIEIPRAREWAARSFLVDIRVNTCSSFRSPRTTSG